MPGSVESDQDELSATNVTYGYESDSEVERSDDENPLAPHNMYKRGNLLLKENKLTHLLDTFKTLPRLLPSVKKGKVNAKQNNVQPSPSNEHKTPETETKTQQTAAAAVSATSTPLAIEPPKTSLEVVRKIYHALFDGDSSWFKRDFFAKHADLNECNCENLITKSQDARAQKALELYNKYCKESEKNLTSNTDLLKEIYQYTFNSGFFKLSNAGDHRIFRSGFSLFCHPTTQTITLKHNAFSRPPEGSRRACILRALQ